MGRLQLILKMKKESQLIAKGDIFRTWQSQDLNQGVFGPRTHAPVMIQRCRVRRSGPISLLAVILLGSQGEGMWCP